MRKFITDIFFFRFMPTIRGGLKPKLCGKDVADKFGSFFRVF